MTRDERPHYLADPGEQVREFANELIFAAVQAKTEVVGVFNQHILIARQTSTSTEVIKSWGDWQRASYQNR